MAKSDLGIDDENHYLNYLSFGEASNGESSEACNPLQPQKTSYFAHRCEKP
jgi:hypothetical protein